MSLPAYFKNTCVICGAKTNRPVCCSDGCQKKRANQQSLANYQKNREAVLQAHKDQRKGIKKTWMRYNKNSYTLEKDLLIKVDLTVEGKRGKLFPLEDDCRYNVDGLDYTRLNVGRQIQKNSREYEK